MFGANFNLVTRVGFNFEHWKTIVFELIVRHQTIFFSHKNVFQNGVNAFSKTVNPFFAKKLKIVYILYHMILFKFHQHVIQILIEFVWRDLRLSMSASIMVT